MAAKQILYATDYSPASLHALQFATWLAHCTGSKLLIVHVSDSEQYPVGELFNEQPEPDGQELTKLKAVVPDDQTIACEHYLLYGEPGSAKITKPADVIVRFANTHRVDMIVLGTHGRTGLLHLLMGSVAESVIRHACCPVISIRQAKNP
jgi:universal stress protein A